MSRTFKATRFKPAPRSLHERHALARHAVRELLSREALRSVSDFHEVLGDRFEERGLGARAQIVRAGEPDLVLPVFPGGANTRLRW